MSRLEDLPQSSGLWGGSSPNGHATVHSTVLFQYMEEEGYPVSHCTNELPLYGRSLPRFPNPHHLTHGTLCLSLPVGPTETPSTGRFIPL